MAARKPCEPHHQVFQGEGDDVVEGQEAEGTGGNGCLPVTPHGAVEKFLCRQLKNLPEERVEIHQEDEEREHGRKRKKHFRKVSVYIERYKRGDDKEDKCDERSSSESSLEDGEDMDVEDRRFVQGEEGTGCEE